MAADPMGPRITYYDDATGERIELSTVTLANWAAKTGNLLRDEMGAGPSSRVAVLLPAHWQTAAVLLGIWWIGADAVLDGDATSVRVHGDQISPERHPGPALDGRSVAEVLTAAQTSAATQGFGRDDRVMSTAGWTTVDELTDNLLAVFAAGASLVQVANPDAGALDRRREMEKVTRG
jgi:NADPH-dependent curcumin reductase CurA